MDIPNPRNAPTPENDPRGPHDARPLMRFRGRSISDTDDPFDEGRFLVFTQLGLRRYDKDGPSMVLTGDDLEAGVEHLRSQVAVYVAAHLDGPVDPDQLRVQFDPNVDYGAVYGGMGSAFVTTALARFNVYRQGDFPQSQVCSWAREWIFIAVVAVLLAGAGFLVGGPVGAFVGAAGVLPFFCFQHGR